ncbi:hypothetical protein PPYR_10074 [Photinus pyralis]|uniref:Cytochrome P450 n=2 Tax=Photinus pyralis TaxID=7054 RepID=A0A5N4AFA8_PHOPY|nr:hypothetical protein PPYR_10074 [Photinus pyralis]
MKQICVKSFDSFTDRPDFIPKSVDPFWKKTLFHREGKDWRDLQLVLSPVFTGRKMRAMFQLMYECSENLAGHFLGESGTTTVEMKDLFTRYTNDATASCFYGIQCDSVKDKRNEFYLMGREAFDFAGLKSIRFFGSKLSPTLIKILRIKFIDDKVKQFFERVTKETIEYRRRTGLVRPDMIQFLTEAQKGRLEYEEDDKNEHSGFAAIEESDVIRSDRTKRMPITDEDIATQVLIFFFGSYDTVSVVFCQLACELVANADVQDKLHKEIDATLKECNGKLTYDSLMNMKYLDMVVSEILRLWPPAVMLVRQCVKAFKINPVFPHEKPYTIQPGDEIIIPSYAIHRNPQYYAKPEQFDPERFNDENKGNIGFCTYQPFGIGPRHCIGNKFALMEVKTGIVSLLSRFQIVPVSKTVIPFVQAKNSIPLRSANDYWFGLRRRDNGFY